MTLIQIVAVGTLPGLPASRTPLADAAAAFLGPAGAAMITVGAVISATGNNMGGAISGSRNLYALAEQGDLPRVFARVHASYRTPVIAILVTSAVALVLALSGTFQTMATASAVSRLVLYVGTCASTLRLRSRDFQRDDQSAGLRHSIRSACSAGRPRDRADGSRWCVGGAASQRRARASRWRDPLCRRRPLAPNRERTRQNLVEPCRTS